MEKLQQQYSHSASTHLSIQELQKTVEQLREEKKNVVESVKEERIVIEKE